MGGRGGGGEEAADVYEEEEEEVRRLQMCMSCHVRPPRFLCDWWEAR
jgi:hypothetical protein